MLSRSPKLSWELTQTIVRSLLVRLVSTNKSDKHHHHAILISDAYSSSIFSDLKKQSTSIRPSAKIIIQQLMPGIQGEVETEVEFYRANLNYLRRPSRSCIWREIQCWVLNSSFSYRTLIAYLSGVFLKHKAKIVETACFHSRKSDNERVNALTMHKSDFFPNFWNNRLDTGKSRVSWGWGPTVLKKILMTFPR